MKRETVWEFKTARFRVTLEIEPEDMDPADSFDDAEAVAEIRRGEVEWFCAVVCVYLDGRKVSWDSLGGCAYRTISEFFTSHRDHDAMNRNCEAMRAARGQNVCICHYFPDMVRQAVSEARSEITRRVNEAPRLRRVA